MDQPDAVLRLPAVVAMAGIGRSEIYRRVEEGRFPRPVQLGEMRIGWRLSDIQRWIAELPTQAPAKGARAPAGPGEAAEGPASARPPRAAPGAPRADKAARAGAPSKGRAGAAAR